MTCGYLPSIGSVAVATLATVCAAATPVGRVDPHIDDQAWSELDVSVPLSRELSLESSTFARWSVDTSEPTTRAQSLGVKVGIGAYLAVTPYLKTANTFDDARHQWSRATQFGSDLNVSVAVPRCDLSDRTRVYSLMSEKGSSWVYRNRPQIECQLDELAHGLSGLASEEFFHFSTQREFTRYRRIVGMRTELNPTWALLLYYLHQTDEVQLPAKLSAVGLTIQLSFGRAR